VIGLHAIQQLLLATGIHVCAGLHAVIYHFLVSYSVLIESDYRLIFKVVIIINRPIS